MRSLNLLLTLLIYCCLSITLASAQNNEITNTQFSHLQEGKGLPDDWVWKVFQDSRGFTWIGTHDGLVRWDGLTFQQYIPNSLDTINAILGASIVDIFEDKEGYIWVASHNKGLSRFDHESETFQNFRHKSHLKGIICMEQDSEGIIWLGSFGNGLFRYDPKTDNLTALPIQKTYAKGETTFRFNSVIDITEDLTDNNILWIGGNNGLFKFDKKQSKFQRFASTAPKTSLMAIYDVKQEPENPNKLWLAGFGGGMILFDIPTATWKYHVWDKKNFVDYDGYKNVVMGMERKSKEEFWVNTMYDSGGIFNTKTGKFTFFKHQHKDPTSINWGTGWSINKDKDGRIWFGFRDRGLSYINPDCQAFYSLPLDMGDCNQQSANNISDFGMDTAENKIYAVANSCDGFFEINPTWKTHKVIPTLGFEGAYQIYSTVFVTRKGKVWVGGRSSKGGDGDHFKRPTLFYLDKQIGKLRPFEHPMAEKLNLHQNNIIDIYEDADENLWVASDNGQLYELNFSTDNINAYSLDQWKRDQPIVEIAQIIESKNGLWVGTSHGVFNFDTTTRSFEQLKGSATYRVSSLAQDSTGLIWFGTKEEGLKLINPMQPDQIIHPDMGNLPRTPIDKVVMDQHNSPWLSTQKGIYFLDKTINYFQHFSKNDGLTFNRFYQHGFYQLPNGNMLLGQDKGYYHLQPQCLLQPQKLGTVFISEFSVPNKNIKQPADKLTKIALAHNENFFNIAFSSQTYCQADKVRFTYQLQGMNQGWVTTSPGRNWTNYTDVQPGAYTFKVHRTGFPETLRSIDILIHSPWWLTWWAYAIYGLLALALLAGIYKLLLSRQDAKREAQAHKAINDAKTKLYANITHEFRTPLTLILGISDQLQKLNLGVAVDNKITGIKNNGNRILQLVNQILDLRKLQSGQLHLKPVQKEVTGLLKYAFQNFEPLAQNKNIRFVSEINFDSLIIDHDPDKLITIISNLLDNAIKFTPKDGQVVYRVAHQETTLSIEVEDTGIGIDEKVVSKVFDRYVSIDSPNYTSTGIGLSLTKALVELMGGTIQAKSTLGKGSIFKVVLPITKKAIAVEENTTRLLKDSPSISSNRPTLFTESFDMDSHKPIILVVEDDQDIAELVAAMLGNSYQIGYASDGQAGMEKALEIIPDLIISDVMMPRMDGFEMCEALKTDQLTSHVPILLLTAKAGDKNKIAGLKRGADTYLTKPINEAELLLSVKNALDSRQALRNFFSLSKKAPTKNRTVKNPISGIDFSIEDMVYQKVLAILDKESSDAEYWIDDLQQAVGLSKSQLNRKLKSLVGLTTGNMIKYFRLEKASELLKTSNKTIAEVAFDVGFKDPSHFTRVFKEAFEMTPSDFRETGVGI